MDRHHDAASQVGALGGVDQRTEDFRGASDAIGPGRGRLARDTASWLRGNPDADRRLPVGSFLSDVGARRFPPASESA